MAPLRGVLCSIGEPDGDAAHAELTIGAAKNFSDVVYVLCGIRTSGASIVGGKVHRGVHDAAGIVGEMPELRWAEADAP
jgi:predicted NBD/HSP70 family sugar kinase